MIKLSSIFRLLIWLVYLFVLLEIAGLIYFRSPWVRPIGGFGYPKDVFVTKDGGMDYGYVPGYRGHFSGGTFNQIPLAINQAGYRDREFGTKTPGVSRLLAFGDSVVFGAGVAAEQRFTEHLQALLSARQPTEVYNLGVNSYAFTNYVATMASLPVRALAPDVELIGFVVNDLGDSGWPADVARGGAKYGWAEPVSFQLYNLAAVQFLVQIRDYAAYLMMAKTGGEEYHTKYMQALVHDWSDPALVERFRRDVMRAKAIAADSQARLIIAMMPELNMLRQPGRFDLPRSKALEIFQAAGLTVCDPYSDFAAQPSVGSLFLPEDDLHFSAPGHELMARSLDQCLAKQGL